MTQDRLREPVSALSEDLPLRILLSTLAQNVAELAAILSLYASWRIPPELVTRLRGIEAELLELSRLCQAPPSTPKGRKKCGSARSPSSMGPPR